MTTVTKLDMPTRDSERPDPARTRTSPLDMIQQALDHAGRQRARTTGGNPSVSGYVQGVDRNAGRGGSPSASERDGEPGRPLRIGFVTIWFERGQAYVTKTLRDALARRHETFVFARAGIVHETAKLETSGQWAVQNLTTHSTYDIPKETLISWARARALDVIVFNEEYDWALVRAVKAAGFTVVTYLDYYRADWEPHMRLYDVVLCSTQRTYELVRDVCRAVYIGWCVDTKVFRPQRRLEPRATFFHNAGWLGINYRKMTPAAILAFDAAKRVLPHATLFVHAQVGPEKLPPSTQRILARQTAITYHVETVPPPGLYHRGEIFLFPSKLEGLGLPLPEAMASGLPVIATDASPMNEFVRHGRTGLLVRVAERVTRHDAIAFPETLCDVGDLVARMVELGRDVERARAMGGAARAFAVRALSMDAFGARVLRVFEKVHANTRRAA